MTQQSLTWSEFETLFRPIRNIFSTDPDSNMFETYGRELDYVKAQPNNTVWTYVDGEMCTLTVNGFHYVNRIGYFVTEIPWEDDVDYEVDLDPYVCDNCEEPFTQDFEHEDGLCENCCKGCEMDEFNN